MLELERYELSRGPAYRFELDRRDFFKLAGRRHAGRAGARRRSTCAGVGRAAAVAATRGRPRSAPGCTSAKTATITVYTGKVEVGQNIRTSLTQAVAEELRVPVGLGQAA